MKDNLYNIRNKFFCGLCEHAEYSKMSLYTVVFLPDGAVHLMYRGRLESTHGKDFGTIAKTGWISK